MNEDQKPKPVEVKWEVTRTPSGPWLKLVRLADRLLWKNRPLSS